MHKHLIPPSPRHRTYRGRYRVGDNPKVHEVTLHTTVKEVAEKKLKEIYEDAQRESVGLIPAAFTRKAKRRPIAEIFEEYLESLRQGGRTPDHVRVVKLRFLALTKGCHWSCMADVSARGFLDWRSAQTKYQARTLNNYRDAAGAFFNWVDRTYEIPNPLVRVGDLPVPVKYPQGPRAFSEEELEKLFAVAKPKRRVLYRLLAFSGLRRREVQRLCWGDVHLDEAPPGLFLRPEATKARRADWLPILSVLAEELRAARPANWKSDTLLFPRGVSDVDTLHRDMVKAGIPLKDKLGRPAGIHTFRRTFISHLQKRAVHSRVIMQLARHKSLRLTDWTYTDTTQLPLTEGVESLAGMASPRSSPLNSGQTGVLMSKAVQAKKLAEKNPASEVAETESSCHALEHAVQSCPNVDLVPGVGLEPTLLCRPRILSPMRIPIPPPGQVWDCRIRIAE
jgi:integrase